MKIQSSRETFDRQLQNLLDKVLVLGSMVEQAVEGSIQALQGRDFVAARRIFGADQRINEMRYTIEHECIVLIATQQPMARDVRFLAAILEIITELERIGDYAKGICKVNLLMDEDPVDQASLAILLEMSDHGLGMLRRALDAFVQLDVATARTIPLEDDQVDQLYNQFYRSVLAKMIADTSFIDRGNHLSWVSHNLERMADRVINICERIVYVSTGEIKELDASDGLK